MDEITAGSLDTPPRPWGIWATLGFTLLVLMGFFLVQTLVYIALTEIFLGPEI